MHWLDYGGSTGPLSLSCKFAGALVAGHAGLELITSYIIGGGRCVVHRLRLGYWSAEDETAPLWLRCQQD